jgi:hypothetical protein
VGVGRDVQGSQKVQIRLWLLRDIRLLLRLLCEKRLLLSEQERILKSLRICLQVRRYLLLLRLLIPCIGSLCLQRIGDIILTCSRTIGT